MKILHRAAAVAFAAAIAAAMSLALAHPASASTARPNAAPDAIGGIVCSGDLCIQTQSCNSSHTKVTIREWAYSTGFFGHFELEDPNGVDYNYPPTNTNWSPGGGHNFTVPLYFDDTYTGIAWKYTPSTGKYTNIGEVHFTVNHC
jgi:hypothetical protein